MDEKIDLTISVVVYQNKLDMLRRLFDSILNANLNLKLFIIDNSSEKMIDRICQGDSVTYIFNNRNVGFGSGHNIAIWKSLGLSKYHLIINPDIYFEKGILEKIYNFMENNSDIGMVMPRVLYPDGSLQYLSRLLPTPLNLLFRKIKVPFFSKCSDYFYELKFADHNKIMDVPYLSGCFMFIRTEAFAKVGLFDERFFMYCEDIDLSRRIHACYRTVYYPEVAVYHGYEKGSSKNLKLLKMITHSAIEYFNKWGWFFDDERKLFNIKTIEALSGN